MTKTESLMADLEQASRIAQEGENTPLVGGPIGLMWGVLIVLAFSIQYLILERILAFPGYSLAILWVSFAVIGGLGVFILGRQADQKPGAQSVGNRVETYIWIMFSGMMGSLAVGIILNQLLSDGTYQLWDIMIIIGFAGQGLGYGVIAKISKLYWLHLASFAAFIFSAVCFVAYGQTHIYLVGAIGTIFTIILPSLKTMKVAG